MPKDFSVRQTGWADMLCRRTSASDRTDGLDMCQKTLGRFSVLQKKWSWKRNGINGVLPTEGWNKTLICLACVGRIKFSQGSKFNSWSHVWFDFFQPYSPKLGESRVNKMCDLCCFHTSGCRCGCFSLVTAKESLKRMTMLNCALRHHVKQESWAKEELCFQVLGKARSVP